MTNEVRNIPIAQDLFDKLSVALGVDKDGRVGVTLVKFTTLECITTEDNMGTDEPELTIYPSEALAGLGASVTGLLEKITDAVTPGFADQVVDPQEVPVSGIYRSFKMNDGESRATWSMLAIPLASGGAIGVKLMEEDDIDADDQIAVVSVTRSPVPGTLLQDPNPVADMLGASRFGPMPMAFVALCGDDAEYRLHFETADVSLSLAEAGSGGGVLQHDGPLGDVGGAAGDLLGKVLGGIGLGQVPPAQQKAALQEAQLSAFQKFSAARRG